MKSVCLILFIFTVFSANNTAFSQDSVKHYNPYDSLLSGLKYTFIYTEEKQIFTDTLFYFDNPKDINRFVRENKISMPANLDAIDYNENALTLVAYSGEDCHSGFIFSLLNDPRNFQYVFDLSVMYGGCHAGGKNYTKWALIPKLPEDYSIILYRHVVYERDSETGKSF